MRKTVAIVLLLTLIFNSLGYILVFKVIQASIRIEVKREIERSLSDDQLEVITFSSAEKNSTVIWTRKGKEFIYKNKMYDIVRTKKVSDKIIFFCINDEKEEKLFSNLDDRVRKNLADNGRVKQILTKSISNYFFEKIKLPQHLLQANPLKPESTKLYSDVCREIESPPPKFS